MAQKRMFSKTITNSSNFLMMPQSSQNLYFHLGMNADDDGFCEHFVIMRMTESKPDDLKILQGKRLVQIFDDKVLVILDWKENNYIRNDRYIPSKYLELYKEELKLIENNNFGIPNDNQKEDNMDTQYRLDKIRLDKIRLNNIYSSDITSIIEYLNTKLDKKYRSDNKKYSSLIISLLKRNFTIDDFKKVIDIKYSHWFNDDKMKQYLRPETLFGSKFETYLNEKIKESIGDCKVIY